MGECGDSGEMSKDPDLLLISTGHVSIQEEEDFVPQFTVKKAEDPGRMVVLLACGVCQKRKTSVNQGEGRSIDEQQAM